MCKHTMENIRIDRNDALIGQCCMELFSFQYEMHKEKYSRPEP